MSEMAGVEVNHIDLTQIVGDIETPCDFLTSWTDTPHSVARWVAWRVPCPCGFTGGPRLICDSCKDHLMLSEAAVECRQCDEVYAPARTIVSHIEALR